MLSPIPPNFFHNFLKPSFPFLVIPYAFVLRYLPNNVLMSATIVSANGGENIVENFVLMLGVATLLKTPGFLLPIFFYLRCLTVAPLRCPYMVRLGMNAF